MTAAEWSGLLTRFDTAPGAAKRHLNANLRHQKRKRLQSVALGAMCVF